MRKILVIGSGKSTAYLLKYLLDKSSSEKLHITIGDINIETIREQFEVNAIAPLRVVDELYQQFTSGSKVAMITSRMGSVADNGSGGRYGYRMSKAALNAAAMSLSKDLAGQNVAVGIYHPGYVQTDMVNHGGDISTNERGQRLVGLINQLTDYDEKID